jgi:CheY-like chemotaxis protein
MTSKNLHLPHLNIAPAGGETIAPSTPCRVFLVEDDIDDGILNKRRLEASDDVKEVLVFPNGAELIRYMKEQGFQDHSVMCMTPTMIIVDLNMPKMDGFQVLQELKSDPFLQDIPVVVVSGDPSYDNIKRAHHLRADGFFSKPLNVYNIRTFFSRAWQWPKNEMWMS